MRKVFFCLLLLSGSAAFAQETAQNAYKKLTLEELMDVRVTSVARTPDPLSRTAAAVTVITAEDIRRSGITSLPELFRLVPSLQVARFGAGSWAISARGFSAVSADKLLVMIDGRTVYSPIFSGVFWEVQDFVLDNIERIEVVRGPGATLWGANAVNGVINIITKSAHQTKGSMLTVSGGGAEDLAELNSRYGAGGMNTSYRIDGKYLYRDQLKFQNGIDAKDSTRVGRMGFRVDTSRPSDEFTLEGDFYNGLEGFPARNDIKLFGGSVTGRATHRFSGTSELQVQSYFTRDYRRVDLQSEFFQRIFDIDLQHNFVASEHHHITWGVEYRWNSDTTRPTAVLSFVPVSRRYPLVTGFVQDEIPLANDRLRVTIGTKFEHNDFSGPEVQPSIRANWAFRPDQAFWAAVSRAVRTPTRFDSDIRFGPPGFLIVGNPDFKSEELFAYEAGYRATPVRKLSLDIATFINKYDRLRSLEFQPPTGILEMNHLNATTYGVGTSLNLDPGANLRVRASYSYLGKRLTLDPGHIDLFNGTLEGNDPKHQFTIQTLADISKRVEWDTTARFVSRLPAPVVPRYFEMDSRIGWNPSPAWEVSLVGRNLLHPRHPEFGNPGPTRTEVERNVYARVAMKF